MKKAWIENNIIRDIAQGDPAAIYHPDIASLYDTDVPDEAQNGDSYVDGVWAAKPEPVVQEPVPPVPPVPPKVTVIEYKMLFTSTERIAAKASTDPVIVDLRDLMDDPRTSHVDLSLQSISDALDYMTAIGLIAEGRKAEILTGTVR